MDTLKKRAKKMENVFLQPLPLNKNKLKCQFFTPVDSNFFPLSNIEPFDTYKKRMYFPETP